MSFFLNFKALREALLNVKEMCYRIGDMGLLKIEKGKTYTLQKFIEAQFEQLAQVQTRLKEFRELVKEIVRNACRLVFYCKCCISKIKMHIYSNKIKYVF